MINNQRFLFSITSIVIVISSWAQQNSNEIFWKNSLINFVTFNDTSVSYSTCYGMEPEILCASDTVQGILFLAKKLKYSLNSEYTCYPSFLYYSTDFKDKQNELYPPRNRSFRGIGMKDLPIEMIKLYYIQSLYEKSFIFKPKVSLGYKKNYVDVGNCDAKHNRKILKKSKKSLEKWIDLLEKKGLEYLRKNNIDPLFFSELEWKG